jgi:hypothetical protein
LFKNIEAIEIETKVTIIEDEIGIAKFNFKSRVGNLFGLSLASIVYTISCLEKFSASLFKFVPCKCNFRLPYKLS